MHGELFTLQELEEENFEELSHFFRDCRLSPGLVYGCILKANTLVHNDLVFKV